MSDLTFVHLTDLHIMSSTEEQLKEQRPADNLRRVIARIRNMKVRPDFFILSGDLANNGEEAEYRTLNRLLDELRGFDAPLILGLGNHDRRVPFRQVVLGEEAADETQRFYHSAMFDGLRVIMLDSKVPDAVHGELDARQLSWLEAELRRPAPLGNLIAVHHPPVFSIVEPLNEHCLRNPDALAQAIKGHNVHAILSGHIHYAHITLFHGTLSVTTPAIAFLLDPCFQQEHRTTDRWGFTLGSLRGGQFYANPLSMNGQSQLG